MFIDLRVPRHIARPLRLQIHEEGGYYIVTAFSHLVARLRVRTAYPGTYCQEVDDGIALGYGRQAHSREDEFLRIFIGTDGTVIIQRDCFVAVPLFYTVTSTHLEITNSYEELATRLSDAELDGDQLLRCLLPDKDYSNTYIKQVKMLGERQTLVLRDGTLHVYHTPAHSWHTSHEAPQTDPLQFFRVLEEAFAYFYQTRLQGQRALFQLSGGLDSCTLPQYIRKVHPEYPLATLSLVYPGTMGAYQHRKLEALQAVLDAEPAYIYLDEGYYMLARFFGQSPRQPHMFSPHEHCYLEMHEAIAAQARVMNADIIVTGVGGDDVMENIVVAEGHFELGLTTVLQHQPKMPPFLTDKFRREYAAIHARATRPPVAALPVTVLMDAAHNNAIIEQDLWCVSPFASPRLYEYCQGLPAYLRANKNILRAYHQARGYLVDIYNNARSEDFTDFMRESLCSSIYNDFATRRASISPFVVAGYVDRNALLRFLHARGPHTDESHLAHWYAWLCAEINLEVFTRHYRLQPMIFTA